MRRVAVKGLEASIWSGQGTTKLLGWFTAAMARRLRAAMGNHLIAIRAASLAALSTVCKVA
jgi:hypothetical protein